MPKFSQLSNQRIELADRRLQFLLNKAIEIYDFSVLASFRGKEEQDAAFALGYSKTEYPGSKHNRYPSLAVDLAPYPIDWNDKESFFLLAGIMLGLAKANNIGLRWGGDWDGDGDTKDQNFNDYGHFELR